MSASLAVATLLASLFAAEPVAAHEVGRSVTRILEQDRYSFCAEGNEFEPMGDDLEWCEIASAAAWQRCPGYAQVCLRGNEAKWADGRMGGGTGGDEQDQGPGEANEGAYEESEAWQLPDLGAFAKILMWLLIIAGVVTLIVVIAKNLVRDQDHDEPEPQDEPGAGDSLIAARAAAMRVVETDVQRLLRRAEEAATRGDFDAAINDVHAALLRRLEGEQLIAVDHWKTNGDYVGELRARPLLRDEVREIVREVEQIQFGNAAADRDRYHSVRAKVAAVVGRAVLAFAAMLGAGSLLGCPLWDRDAEDELPKSAALAGLGTGPADHRAVAELLLVHDIEAKHRTRSIEQLTGGDGAIVLLEGVDLVDEDWDTLIRWLEDDGGTLIIATGEDFPRELGVDYKLFEPSTALEPSIDQIHFAQLELVAPAGQVLEARGVSDKLLMREPEPLEDELWISDADAKPYALRRRIGDNDGHVVVFAEPDMWTNIGISVADNATFLVNFLRTSEITEVEFVNRYTGSGPDDPFESMANAKLGGLFLQILLFLGLLYACVGIPFARLRDPQSQRRRAFVEHVETLGQRYAQARASRYVAGLYSAWALDRLRERLRPSTGTGLLPLAQAIAARTGRDETSVMQLLVAIHELRENSQHSVRGSASDLALMRQLAQLLDEIR